MRAGDQECTLAEIVGKKDRVDSIALDKYVSDTVGMPTLKDIAAELIKPGRDPREDGARLMFSDDVADIEDLEENMTLPGTVTNVTNFGAFVDIGVHQDGLVHISELSDNFVDDPAKVVSVGDVVKVRVIDVDTKRRRISLSMKSGSAEPRTGQSNQNKNKNEQGQPGKRNLSKPSRPNSNRKTKQMRQRPAQQQKFTVEDLVAKFNQRR